MPILAATAIFAIWGVYLGLLLNNDGVYLLQDLFKSVAFFFACVLGVWCAKSSGTLSVSLLVKIGVFFCLLRLVGFWIFNDGRSMLYGTTADVLLVVLYLMYMPIKEIGRPISYRNITYLLLIMMIILAGQKRTLFIIIPLVIVMHALTIYGFRMRALFLAAVLLVPAIAIFVSSERVSIAGIAAKASTSDGRTQEVVAVMEKIGFENSYMSGLGFGAVYEAPPSRSKYPGHELHTVHFTPVALYFRAGLIGLIYYFFLAHLSIRLMLRAIGSRSSMALIYCYPALSLLCSVPLYGFVDDPIVAFILGVGWAKKRSVWKSDIRGAASNSGSPLPSKRHTHQVSKSDKQAVS